MHASTAVRSSTTTLSIRGEDILFRPADGYVQRFVRKVDLSRTLYAHEALVEVPVLSQSETTADCTAALLREHPGVIVVDGTSLRVLTAVAQDRPMPTASVEADATLGRCFPVLAGHEAAVVMKDGTPAGILTREMAFKVLSLSARAA